MPPDYSTPARANAYLPAPMKRQQNTGSPQALARQLRPVAAAVRTGGGNAAANPRLRLAIEKARAAGVPASAIAQSLDRANMLEIARQLQRQLAAGGRQGPQAPRTKAPRTQGRQTRGQTKGQAKGAIKGQT